MISSTLIPQEVWDIITEDMSVTDILAGFLSGVIPRDKYYKIITRKIIDLTMIPSYKRVEELIEPTVFIRKLIMDRTCNSPSAHTMDDGAYMYQLRINEGLSYCEKLTVDYGYSYLSLWPIRCEISFPAIIRSKVYDLTPVRRLMSVLIGPCPLSGLVFTFLEMCSPTLDMMHVSSQIGYDDYGYTGRAYGSLVFRESHGGQTIRDIRNNYMHQWKGDEEVS